MAQLMTLPFAVTVFPDRARLIRHGKIHLEAGVHQLEIPDLPLQMNPDSMRAAAHGTARARLLGLQVHKLFFTETPAEQVRELEAQMEAGQDEQRSLDTQSELVKSQRSQVAALMSHTQIFATAMAAGEMSVEESLALFDGLRKQLEALDNEQQQVVIRKRSLERRLQQLKNQLDQLRGARPRERYAAIIELDVTQAGDLTVELTYVISQAGWKPLYDLRLVESNNEAHVELSYLAQVTQQSGENWDAVDLVLSTARPALAATLPELDPWYLLPAPAPTPRMKKSLAAEAPPPMAFSLANQAEMAREMTVDEAEAEVSTAQVEASGAAVTYRLPSPVGIPGDGAPHKVTVACFSLPTNLDFVAAPKLAEAAFRRARVGNNSPYTLLPGLANLFAGEEFIGSTRLKLTPPQAEIELYLGADDRVKIERELKRRDINKALIGGKRQVHYGYEIRLENLLPAPVHVIVHDQIPAPRHEEIKVRLETAEPKPSSHSELNLLDWELTLAAREKRTLRFDFNVEYPQGMEVLGLP